LKPWISLSAYMDNTAICCFTYGNVKRYGRIRIIVLDIELSERVLFLICLCIHFLREKRGTNRKKRKRM
jgi:hypothetical protein